jgi:histidinol-phosphate aminotransferase
MDIRSLLRPHLLNLVPYSSARDEFKGTANVFLDANENALGSTSDSKYRRYPDPYQVELKKKIGEIKHLNPSKIFLGNGSDEPIDLLLRAFCNPGTDRIIITPPTYGMYEVCANINDVGITRVPLNKDDFTIKTEQILQSIEPGVKIIFLCSPNNPTGNSIDKEAIIEILEKFQGLVVLDEAYIDFSPNESMISELKDFRRLIILQTFSKAWGLAALRLGVLYGDEEIISILNMIKPPYNIGQATQELALEAISRQSRMQKMVGEILRNKHQLESSLNEISSVRKIYPSDANFILIRIDDAHEVYLKLIDSKVIVRDRSKVELCEDCLRITVGTEAENNQLTAELKKICS